MTKQRKSPLILRDCQPGDVVCVPKRGKILVTGNCMGTTGAHRLVRLIDEDGKQGPAFPLPTGMLVTEIIKLAVPIPMGEDDV